MKCWANLPNYCVKRVYLNLSGNVKQKWNCCIWVYTLVVFCSVRTSHKEWLPRLKRIYLSTQFIMYLRYSMEKQLGRYNLQNMLATDHWQSADRCFMFRPKPVGHHCQTKVGRQTDSQKVFWKPFFTVTITNWLAMFDTYIMIIITWRFCDIFIKYLLIEENKIKVVK